MHYDVIFRFQIDEFRQCPETLYNHLITLLNIHIFIYKCFVFILNYIGLGYDFVVVVFICESDVAIFQLARVYETRYLFVLIQQRAILL